MTNRWRGAAAVGLIALALNLLLIYEPGASSPRPRRVELTETVTIEPPASAKEIRLWIPKPPSREEQEAEIVSVNAELPHQVTSESEFGNETIFLKAVPRGPGPIEVTVRYRVTRRPQSSGQNGEPRAAERTARGLLAVDEEIRRIAREKTRGLATPMQKGRALYDYVLSRMTYDKSGEGWGRGDSVYACKIGKGNCTDFHSLFMALAFASGIPARFRMGFSLPEAAEGEIVGYHCWAEFYAEGTGWVPVDISEAWKNPARRAFYFGRLDESRVLVSTGREIRLSPPQRGRPLNFLNRPYAEADGKPVHKIIFSRRYRDLRGPA